MQQVNLSSGRLDQQHLDHFYSLGFIDAYEKAWMMGEIISGQEDVVNDGGGKGVRESLRKSQRFGSEIASVSHG